jgi:hypothetical protein
MALDAYVCCDCFERGTLLVGPPAGCNLSVCADGSLSCGSVDLDVQLAFDRWQQSEACDHEFGILIAHRIGNIDLVAALRRELGRWPDRFQMVLSRVIYNGAHAGDFIPAFDVPRLVPEVEALGSVQCEDPEMLGVLRLFAAQMQDLVAVAMRLGKPIVF